MGFELTRISFNDAADMYAKSDFCNTKRSYEGKTKTLFGVLRRICEAKRWARTRNPRIGGRHDRNKLVFSYRSLTVPVPIGCDQIIPRTIIGKE